MHLISLTRIFAVLLSLASFASAFSVTLIPPELVVADFGGVALTFCGENHALQPILGAASTLLPPATRVVQQLYQSAAENGTLPQIQALFSPGTPAEEISELKQTFSAASFNSTKYVLGRTYLFIGKTLVFVYQKDKATDVLKKSFYCHAVIRDGAVWKLIPRVSLADPLVLLAFSAEHGLMPSGVTPLPPPAMPHSFDLEDAPAGTACISKLQFGGKVFNTLLSELPAAPASVNFLRHVHAVYSGGTVSQIADLWPEGEEDESEREAVRKALTESGLTGADRARFGSPQGKLLLQIGGGDTAIYFMQRPGIEHLEIIAARRDGTGVFRLTTGLSDLEGGVPSVDRNLLKVLASSAFEDAVKAICAGGQ